MTCRLPTAAVRRAGRRMARSAFFRSARAWHIAVLLILTTALAACAGLPTGVDRPASQAVHDTAGTRLMQIADASRGDAAPALSGFRLLASGGDALEARLALARAAQRSLDVQYYLVASDATGLRLLRELRDAAGRGVRVRLLVDDLYAGGQDALLAGLAAHPNVEVRLFNPLPARDGSPVSRVVLSAHQFSRINRRMHNKLFVADNAFAVSGGRNVADEYFGRGAPAHFIDMDVLSAGPVVREMSAVFDGYWNSEHAYPVDSLSGAPGATAARRHLDAEVARQRFDAAVDAAEPIADGPADATALAAQLTAGRVDLTFARAEVVADSPAKIDASSGMAATSGAAAPPTVMSRNLELLGAARSDVLLASPYFVPGERGIAVLRQAVANKVELTVITNSLSTTDEPLVHHGYSRYREALLRMGVALYELMPEAARSAEGPADGGHGSLGRLHAKLAVVDHRFLFIGSMNMDARSAGLNTEMALIIDSPVLAGEVAALLQRERLPGSYRLRIAGSGPAERLEWVAGAEGAQTVHRSEPGAGALRNLRLKAASIFVREEML